MHMHTRKRTLRFTAVLTFVVLSLTGFSSGRHRSHHGSGGGGCGSSHQDHDTSTSSTSGGGSYDDPDDDYYGSSGTTGGTGTTGGVAATGGTGTTGGTVATGGSGTTGESRYGRRPTHRATSTPSGGSAEPLRDGTARLISCATQDRPYATVEITNPNGRDAEFQTRVTFYDDEGTEILDNSSYTVEVPAKGKATARVTAGGRILPKVHRCEADRVAQARPGS
ncbi:hypothetical protein ACGFT2_10555 [Streptomyces sp. NPDC048514]|uniref:hypothetical protein n=1 Tax=Streptomyces sp. NPDC048514 TaxID=3365564 RepID=UPI003714912A